MLEKKYKNSLINILSENRPDIGRVLVEELKLSDRFQQSKRRAGAPEFTDIFNSRTFETEMADFLRHRLDNDCTPEESVVDLERFLNEGMRRLELWYLQGIQIDAPLTLEDGWTIAGGEYFESESEGEKNLLGGNLDKTFLRLDKSFPAKPYVTPEPTYCEKSDSGIIARSIVASIAIILRKPVCVSLHLLRVEHSFKYGLFPNRYLLYQAGSEQNISIGMPNSGPSSISKINSTDLSDVYKSVCSFGKPKPLWLIADRLLRASIRYDPVDIAIDSGMAIEMMLLHGESGLGAKGELRYKVANRGAWLLGESKSERMELFSKFQKAYDIRSKAVHTGTLSDADNQEVLACNELGWRIFGKFVENGKFIQDWKSVIL